MTTEQRVDPAHMARDMAAERGTALVVQPRPESTAMALWGTDSPRGMTARMSEVADAIRDVIRARGLFTDIQGREYVNIEGWSMTGAIVGVFPRTREVEAVEEGFLEELTITKHDRGGNPYEKVYPAFDGVISYRATVDLVMRDGGSAGGASAMCSRREEQWRDRDDNQIASMAQTRAAAKAYRMTLGFVMPMAGYAPTPAEEMTGDIVLGRERAAGARSTTGEPLDGSAGPPKCSKHNRAMKEWGAKSATPHWKCTAKSGDGYCTETAPMKTAAAADGPPVEVKHQNGVAEPAQVRSIGDLYAWGKYHYNLGPADLTAIFGVEKVGDVRAAVDALRGEGETDGYASAMRTIRKTQGDDDHDHAPPEDVDPDALPN